MLNGKPRDRWIASTWIILGLLTCLIHQPLQAQQIHRNGFASRQTFWQRGEDNVRAEEKIHEISEQYVHSGSTSERISLVCAAGTNDSNYAYYYYPTQPAPISEELSACVWVKSGKSGIQLQARLVLPKEKNPKQIDTPLTTIIPGNTYNIRGTWQRLEIPRPTKLVNDEKQRLRIQFGKDIDFTDAYIDRLILNCYTGAGSIDIFIDDLEIGPVKAAAAPPPQISRDQPTALPKINTRQGKRVVRMEGDRLTVDNIPVFFKAIRYSNTPLHALRNTGFDTVYFDPDTPTDVLEEAILHGFYIIPTLPLVSEERTAATSSGITPGQLTARKGTTAELASAKDVQGLATAIGRFISGDGVLFWDLGWSRSSDQLGSVARTVKAIQAADPLRPKGADIFDGFQDYSYQLDLIGTHRFPLGTSLEFEQYRDWFTQRRNLTASGKFMWTWIQTHMPDWQAKLLYDQTANEAFKEPVGPTPEQIRILTYLSLASGCKGLGFWSDRFLADSHQGRDRLLMMAMLNQEIKMLEPILLSLNDNPKWIDTSDPNVKAVVLRSPKGILVMPIWLGRGAQYVPPQGAISNLRIIVPLLPDGMQPWELSPGRVQSLQQNCVRRLGGTELIIPEFDLTAAVVFTSDHDPDGVVVKWQDHSRRIAKLVAQWAIDLSAVEFYKVSKVHAELEQLAPPLVQAERLLRESQRRLEEAKKMENEGDDQTAYMEALRSMRPLRILMRAHWEQAISSLDLPSASPYATTFFSLPRHWKLQQQVRSTTVGPNTLRDGNFEEAIKQPGFKPANSTSSSNSVQQVSFGANVTTLQNWTVQETTTDEVQLEAKLVSSSLAKVERKKEPPTKKNPYDASSPNRRIQPAEQPEPTLGESVLRLQITPKTILKSNNKVQGAPEALERTFLAVNTPAVHLEPGTLVRISAWVYVPSTISASADGALFYDNIAGEALSVRLKNPTNGWRHYHLYRRVPENGVVWATMALTGIGTAFFDDVRIEPLLPTDTSKP